ncbi:hypothetical protein STAQ_19070 [Allostella sp. ATCC 35155]|nr:hypothetical protein STAQ_19070 [Stella sp. ATCC 35155]
MAKDDDRLAAALRENLRRRKTQGRARAEREPEPQPEPQPPAAPTDSVTGALSDRTAMD